MAYFDRYDIAEAHYLFARHYHEGGDTERRDFWRLSRMGFKPGLSLSKHDDPALALTENGAEIYALLVAALADAEDALYSAGEAEK